MKINDVKDYLLENAFSELEEIEYNGKAEVLRAFYDFDDDELKAARAYANDESDCDEESEQWYTEFFLPYLNDVAIDNIGEVLEEAMESFEIKAQFVSYEMDMNNFSYIEFIVAFTEEDTLDLDSILDEIGA